MARRSPDNLVDALAPEQRAQLRQQLASLLMLVDPAAATEAEPSRGTPGAGSRAGAGRLLENQLDVVPSGRTEPEPQPLLPGPVSESPAAMQTNTLRSLRSANPTATAADPPSSAVVPRAAVQPAVYPTDAPLPPPTSAGKNESSAHASVDVASARRVSRAGSTMESAASNPGPKPRGPGSSPATSASAASDAATPPESTEHLEPGDWRDSLLQSLDTLEKELARFDFDREEEATLLACTRLLHAVANHRDQAVADIQQLPAEEREFWQHQMYALLLALNAENRNAPNRRAALAVRELRAATDALANLSSLDVRSLAFCEAVESYGRFTEFRTQSFRPGTEVLLYVEIDNFTVDRAGDKFETELLGSYDIVDSAGNRVKSVVLPPDKQQCNNRRRDYFIAYRINLPNDLPAGSYTLNLTIEDAKGRKSSQGSLDFRMR